MIKLITAHCRKLAKSLKPKSVDVILTDPIYQKMWQYRFTALWAKVLLKDDGHLLVWYGGNKEHKYIQEMENCGMNFRWRFLYVVPAKTYVMHAYNIFVWDTPLLWFQPTDTIVQPFKRVPSTYISSAQPTGDYKWNKNLGVIEYYLSAFTKSKSLVLDFFAGHGSVGRACKRLGRNYIGCEIDPVIAKEGRRLIRLEQVPMIHVEPEQPHLFQLEEQ